MIDHDDAEGAGPLEREAPTPVAETEAGANEDAFQLDDSAPFEADAKQEYRGRIKDLCDIPAFYRYAQRVGAEARSLRTAVAREQVGRYPRDVATIILESDWTITVKVPVGEDAAPFEPTEAERHDIAAEASKAKWPQYMRPKSISNPHPIMAAAGPEDLTDFRDDEGNIIMVQVLQGTGAEKTYLPFCFFDDREWRMIEPEGLLPLWGLDQLKHHSTVFIHEGAKAARHVRRMVEAKTPDAKAALARHPWGRHLTHAAHLGWIGGALSPHRTDWSVLKKYGVTHVIISADNDAPGHAAIPKISKLLASYPITVDALRFHGFPVAFDLADPFPDKMFVAVKGTEEKRFNGPSFADHLFPATHATRIGPAPAAGARGRPANAPHHLRPEFIRDWFMVISEGKPIFIHRRSPSRFLDSSSFDALVRPFSDHPRTSDLFKLKGYESVVHAIAFEPDQEPGAINLEGRLCFNTWTPSRIKPTPGDPALWLELLDYMFPLEEDRHHVKRWFATLIACPDIRILFGLLLASVEQGVGKTTLCEILRVLLGEQNCSAPSVNDVVHSAFNSWIVRKRLVFVNEIYEGHGWKAYNKIKSYVTDTTLEANEKMIKGYSIRNWAHFILCSNSETPIMVERKDRRVLAPTVTEQPQPASFWRKFYAWLGAGGYGIIAQWALDFVKVDGNAILPGEVAPDTARKTQLIADSRSNEERLVADLATAAQELSKETGQQVVLVNADVMAWLQTQPGRPTYLKPSLVGTWLKNAGMYCSADRMTVAGVKTFVSGVLPITSNSWPELKVHQGNIDDLTQM